MTSSSRLSSWMLVVVDVRLAVPVLTSFVLLPLEWLASALFRFLHLTTVTHVIFCAVSFGGRVKQRLDTLSSYALSRSPRTGSDSSSSIDMAGLSKDSEESAARKSMLHRTGGETEVTMLSDSCFFSFVFLFSSSRLSSLLSHASSCSQTCLSTADLHRPHLRLLTRYRSPLLSWQ